LSSFSRCHSQGNTLEEALNNIKEVIELCIEELVEEGEKLPDPENLLVKNNVAVEYDA